MTVITSTANPRVKAVQHLHTARGRRKSQLFLMEGLNLLEALLIAHIVPHEIYYQPALLQRTARGVALLDRLLQLPADHLIEVSERVSEALSETQTSQGVICVLPLNLLHPEHIQTRRGPGYRPALLILDSLTDPGNLGTILRTALAANVERVLLTADCVDYCNPKVLRAAAGAHLFLPIETDLSWVTINHRILAHCDQNPRVLLAEATGTSNYYDLDLSKPFALIIGNEAHGPSHEAITIATHSIGIPLANNVESLNAAIATSIILYEAVRQVAQSVH